MKNRVFVFLLGAGLGVAGLLPSNPAQALPRREVVRVYYSDASMTRVVGERNILSCAGAAHGGWGRVTPYYRSESTSCGRHPFDEPRHPPVHPGF